MAETNLKKYSVVEKLNKMDVDLIDVEITLDADAFTDGNILFQPTKIENAVAVPQGTSVLHSVCGIVENAALASGDGTDTDSMHLFITSSKTTTGFAAANAAASGGTAAYAVMNRFCGQVTINNYVDAGRQAIGSVQNVGMVCKADADSKDLYVWGMATGTNDYDSGTLMLRFGFIKD